MLIRSLPNTTVIITMAGRGSRFRQAGYNVPKYEIEARGRTLFAWSMESLASFREHGAEFIFVHLEEDQPRSFVSRECGTLGIDRYRFVALPALTDGQATSALSAAAAVDDWTRPVAIYNIDTYVESRYLPAQEVRGAGWIPCFPGAGSGWSFVRTEGDHRAVEVREKQRISPHATVGLYWFDSFERYSDLYSRYYGDPANIERGERYIAPLYNQLIRDGASVYMHPIPFDGVHPLGTPEEVESFKYEREACGSDPDLQRREAAAGIASLVLPGRSRSE